MMWMLALKCRRSVFEELLLLPVEDRRLQMILITDRRDRNLFSQVLFQDDDLFFRAVMFTNSPTQVLLRSA
jgi:hypothetical protein